MLPLFAAAAHTADDADAAQDYQSTGRDEDVEDVDEDILYDLMRDHGDVEECEIMIFGPLEHEIEEEWDDE